MSLPEKLRDSGNLLLDRLPRDEYDDLRTNLKEVELELREVIHPFDSEVEYAYFPTTALASMLVVLDEDEPVESATVGREGFLGIAAMLGVAESPHRVICQIQGQAYRIPVRELSGAARRSPALDRLIRRFIAHGLRLTGQGIACNALHTVEARACRWLLVAHDQAEGKPFPMTQEFLSSMLGVRRQSVTVVAGSLQAAGLIRYHRGTMTLLDRERVEQAACECYAKVRGYYDRFVR